MFQLLKGKLQNKTKQKSLRPVNQANKQEKKKQENKQENPNQEVKGKHANK